MDDKTAIREFKGMIDLEELKYAASAGDELQALQTRAEMKLCQDALWEIRQTDEYRNLIAQLEGPQTPIGKDGCTGCRESINRLRNPLLSVPVCQVCGKGHGDATDKIVGEKKPEKQTCKLSEMYVGWWRVCITGTVLRSDTHFLSVKSARNTLSGDRDGTLIAITRADATEFYEGENL